MGSVYMARVMWDWGRFVPARVVLLGNLGVAPGLHS